MPKKDKRSAKQIAAQKTCGKNLAEWNKSHRPEPHQTEAAKKEEKRRQKKEAKETKKAAKRKKKQERAARKAAAEEQGRKQARRRAFLSIDDQKERGAYALKGLTLAGWHDGDKILAPAKLCHCGAYHSQPDRWRRTPAGLEIIEITTSKNPMTTEVVKERAKEPSSTGKCGRLYRYTDAAALSVAVAHGFAGGVVKVDWVAHPKIPEIRKEIRDEVGRHFATGFG